MLDPPRRRRLDVEQATRAENPLLAADVHLGRPLVDEVELVLRVVVVADAGVARRVDDAVDAECAHTEWLPDLAKSGAFSELVERTERVRHQADLLGASV